MKSIVFPCLLALLPFLPLKTQNPFEGLIHYSISYSQEIPGAEGMLPKASQNIVSKSKALTRMVGGMQASLVGDILYDQNTDSIHFINEKTKTVHSVPASEMEDEATVPSSKVTKTKEKATILGYACRAYKVEVTQGDETLHSTYWITQDFKPATTGKSGATSTEGLNLPGFPMKVETELPIPGMDGLTMTMTVTRLQPLSELDPKVLSIPLGFERKAGLPSLMRMGQ